MRRADSNAISVRGQGGEGGGEIFFTARREHHPGTGFGKTLRHGQSNTARGSRDEGDFSIQTNLHAPTIPRHPFTGLLQREGAITLATEIPMTNRLVNSTSAYLRQHADNPVDWFEWGDEAFARARELDRPIFLSVGYSACHWCHVMAHESFEDEALAAMVNERFVPVKVDREERPDVDALYMAATQLVSGHGGWPMTVFLTPDGSPFMAGTYYPPTDRAGHVGLERLLLAMDDAWRTQRATVEQHAQELSEGLLKETRFLDHLTSSPPIEPWAKINDALVDDLVARCDEDGGFGGAPKFPRPSYLEALLHRLDDPVVAAAAERSLAAMSERGLYDHVGGGFARYSVDAQWHVPHFEKMLSDQALLASVYLRADRAQGGHARWREVALDTLSFVVRELRTPSGYASSLDADSNGGEGLHITWTPDEVAEALRARGHDTLIDATCAYYGISPGGNFEGRSIPMLSRTDALSADQLVTVRAALYAARQERVPAGRDDKVILEWNAMFAAACAESRDPQLLEVASELLRSLSSSHRDERGWWRTQSKNARATAGDLAWLMEAQLSMFEASGDAQWLNAVRPLADELMAHYWDGPRPTPSSRDVGLGFWSTHDEVSDLPQRLKEIFDNATPSSHAVAATAFARAAMIMSSDDYRVVAERLVQLASSVVNQHPSAVPDLLRAWGFLSRGREIVIPGPRGELADLVALLFVPFSVLITGSEPASHHEFRERGLAYVCTHGVCQQPVARESELRLVLART